MIQVDAQPGDRVRITIEATLHVVETSDGTDEGGGPWINLVYGKPHTNGARYAIEIPADDLDVYADVEVVRRAGVGS